MNYRVLLNRLNGRPAAGRDTFSYEDARAEKGSNHWSCTEYNRTNARNVNFSTGNANGNNKYNSNVVRAVTAFGDSVPQPFINSVWEAFVDCLRGKAQSQGAIEYIQKAPQDIPELARELWTGTYKPGTSTCFLVSRPKWREIFAASFRDRIVHHWICLRLEPLFEERFISQGNVSFNCRKGFGVDRAVEHVAQAMKNVSGNYHKPAWVFKGDLVGFFMSINKNLLWYLLERFIVRWRKRYERERVAEIQRQTGQDKEMYWDILLRTTKVVVMHHPEKDCVFNSPVSLWRKHIPANKTLFYSANGEPIGNLTTQLFANFLMSHFVSYVRFLFRRKRFDMAQFVDDFLIVCDDKRFLIDAVPKIEAFLRDKLGLTLHKDKRYLQPVSHGVLFVGTYIKPGRRYLGNKVFSRFEEKCAGYAAELTDDGIPRARIEHISQSLNSYLGFCRRRKTYKRRREIMDSMGPCFWKYFNIEGHYERASIKAKYKMIKNL